MLEVAGREMLEVEGREKGSKWQERGWEDGNGRTGMDWMNKGIRG